MILRSGHRGRPVQQAQAGPGVPRNLPAPARKMYSGLLPHLRRPLDTEK
jgi:hypothetical protein